MSTEEVVLTSTEEVVFRKHLMDQYILTTRKDSPIKKVKLILELDENIEDFKQRTGGRVTDESIALEIEEYRNAGIRLILPGDDGFKMLIARYLIAEGLAFGTNPCKIDIEAEAGDLYGVYWMTPEEYQLWRAEYDSMFRKYCDYLDKHPLERSTAR